ncbi:hypothetical protein G6F46_000619 [Rhizopus delemar]|nr:hypothetical protein G6F43_005158 [Rhizopus delemar]KAG1553118.1 hypothetical protein G6F51_000809 [Rhizopus arrhizus]KAG1447137.1 hypothetical protein G6F55_011239 [Rhizopus delemar]KAG1505139.1 hypothetical protein G6F54_000509 [Rhizopus delemar]KAG1514561.1 hypothetical protein G6F52_009891 [Rhizopus delemar]
MKSYNYHKTISSNDKALVDLCRCLYQVKAVVRDLQSFSNTLCPALNQYPKLYDTSSWDDDLMKQANQYLNTTFRKFTRLCKLLLFILTRMEARQVKRERIDSFRTEIWQEWKTATTIKQRLIQFTEHNNNKESAIYTKSFTAANNTTTTATEL